MPKTYFISEEGTPVEFPYSSGKQYEKFLQDNEHLKDKQVTEEEYHAAMVEVDKSIVRNRRAQEYPPIGDQLDAIMKWAFTETEIGLPAELKSLAGKCMSVKAKYPIDGEK